MVTDMPEKMKEEWPLPSFLLCGGYTDNIAFINVWYVNEWIDGWING